MALGGTLGSALYVQGREGCVRVFCRADVYVQDVCGVHEINNCSPACVCVTLRGNKGTLGSALFVQGRDGCVCVFCRADVYVQDVCGAYEIDNCSPACVSDTLGEH